MSVPAFDTDSGGVAPAQVVEYLRDHAVPAAVASAVTRCAQERPADAVGWLSEQLCDPTVELPGAAAWLKAVGVSDAVARSVAELSTTRPLPERPLQWLRAALRRAPRAPTPDCPRQESHETAVSRDAATPAASRTASAAPAAPADEKEAAAGDGAEDTEQPPARVSSIRWGPLPLNVPWAKGDDSGSGEEEEELEEEEEGEEMEGDEGDGVFAGTIEVASKAALVEEVLDALREYLLEGPWADPRDGVEEWVSARSVRMASEAGSSQLSLLSQSRREQGARVSGERGKGMTPSHTPQAAQFHPLSTPPSSELDLKVAGLRDPPDAPRRRMTMESRKRSVHERRALASDDVPLDQTGKKTQAQTIHTSTVESSVEQHGIGSSAGASMAQVLVVLRDTLADRCAAGKGRGMEVQVEMQAYGDAEGAVGEIVRQLRTQEETLGDGGVALNFPRFPARRRRDDFREMTHETRVLLLAQLRVVKSATGGAEEQAFGVFVNLVGSAAWKRERGWGGKRGYQHYDVIPSFGQLVNVRQQARHRDLCSPDAVVRCDRIDEALLHFKHALVRVAEHIIQSVLQGEFLHQVQRRLTIAGAAPLPPASLQRKTTFAQRNTLGLKKSFRRDRRPSQPGQLAVPRTVMQRTRTAPANVMSESRRTDLGESMQVLGESTQGQARTPLTGSDAQRSKLSTSGCFLTAGGDRANLKRSGTFSKGVWNAGPGAERWEPLARSTSLGKPTSVFGGKGNGGAVSGHAGGAAAEGEGAGAGGAGDMADSRAKVSRASRALTAAGAERINSAVEAEILTRTPPHPALEVQAPESGLVKADDELMKALGE